MPPPPPPPREMPLHPSTIATRFATHWIVDALAGDESIDFSVLQALLGASSEPLAGAPEATRERVALRSLQELSSLIPAGADAAATAGVLKVDGAPSCEDVLSRLIREVENSGKLDKDLLPLFSQDIQEIIRTKKFTLPETYFQLLNGVDPWITYMTSPSQLEHNASELGHLPECITAQDTTMISQPDSRKAQQHERGETVNQHLEDVSANIRPVEKDHAHGDLTLQSASALLSISFNGANKGSISGTNLQTGTAATEDRMAFEDKNADKFPLEVSGANEDNQALHDDGGMMKNNTVCGERTVQTAPVSQNCNVTLHGKTSEANCFSEQKNEKSRTDVEKDNCRTSVPNSSKDRDRESAKKTSNEEKSKDTSPEISVYFKDQDIDDTLEDLSQQDFCIKCGKYGELLTCCDCSLAAHASCFGSSVKFQGTDLLYCPVCFCKKAKEAYLKAKKTYFKAKENVAAYIGTAQVSKRYDEQLNGVHPGAANRDGHSNGCDTSKRNSIHQNEAHDLANQNEAHDLAHQDEEPHQPRKKQRINARGNGYPEEVLAENAPFQNPGPASMNKHSVLQNNSETRVEDPEKKQQVGDKEARKEDGDDNSSSDKRRASSQRCDPSSNQDSEADQKDNLAASNHTNDSDEIEATSSNDPGKQSSPPWRNMRHGKKRLHGKESAVPSISRKVTAKQGGHVPQKRYCNRVAPTRRRDRLAWTEAEEAGLRDAMAKFTPQVGQEIPWIQILEYGRHVFHKTRLPSDLRTKWRNMQNKTDAGNLVEH